MIKRHGIERIGFVTLTFPDNVMNREEAQRRYHSLTTSFLGRSRVDGTKRTVEHIATIERQLRGALHYHLLAAFPVDIRTGFDFASASAASAARRLGDKAAERQHKQAYYRSANAHLASWWKELRTSVTAYGFGRCETLPVLSNSAAVTRYVGSYVASDWKNRGMDRGLRTVRYSRVVRVASCRWSWAAGNGHLWRRGCNVLGCLLATDALDIPLGKNWSWDYREAITLFGKHFAECSAHIADKLSDNSDESERLEFGQALVEHCRELEKQEIS